MNQYFVTARAHNAGGSHRKLVYADTAFEATEIARAFYTRLWSDLCLPIEVSAEKLEVKL